ncbi:CotH kinase family protein [Agromyces atrinae]|uniref:Spore coat protein CotH n=1 Tax=Agromyces atrinae TaxID=592376 RepID=A0A4Q2M9F1_9MICO|nr:CotH kinase family protein [Agromyces atrinae]NYD67113.1 spore coat protein CotH [Agromyces atrinae]RXZ87043.1 hypothetical protein ESP50_08295 [Agromyces atrinae]
MTITTRIRYRAGLLAAGSLLVVGSLAGCTAITPTTDASSTAVSAVDLQTTGDFWDSGTVHTISVELSDDALDEALSTYLDSGEKVWVSGTVTIDGETFENIGLKLKGNSSLRGASVDSDPVTLPWIIRLDEFVDGQNLDGETEFVVRGNSSESSLNEAVALDLLDASGLAAEQAVATRFSVNGSDATLRLVVQNPGEEWVDQVFGTDGLLYKADSRGDYSYRGDDAAAYTDVFTQKAGDDDLTPLIDFLQFINESDDETFAAELGEHLDVESFATYLAFQDLVDNFDDISGPGNNSYLYYDPATGLMEVVNWDLNLAFGSSPGDGGGQEGAGQGGAGQGGAAPGSAAQGGARDGQGGMPVGDDTRGAGAAPGGAAGGMDSSNVLAERFLADPGFSALYDAAVAELQSSLVDSGQASAIIDAWVAVLGDQASDLIGVSTLESEAAGIRAYVE